MGTDQHKAACGSERAGASSEAAKRHPVAIVVALALLAVFVARIHQFIQVHSLTTDERVHIAAGYAYWSGRDFRINIEHPPLVKLVAASLPYATVPVDPVRSLDYPGSVEGAERYVADFYKSLGAHRQTVVDRSRYAAALFSLVLAIILFFAARSIYLSNWAGILVLFFFTFDPNVLAHAAIVHTDIASALGTLAGFLALLAWWRRPCKRRAMLVGAVTALGCLLKFSLVLLPIFAALVFCARAWTDRHSPPGRNSLASLAGRYALHAAIAAGVLYGLLLAGYLFVGMKPSSGTLLWPEGFLEGFQSIVRHQRNGHPAYLFGRFSQNGWWLYFPAAALLKAPVAVLIWCALGAFFWVRDRRGVQRNLWILMTATYAFFSLRSTVNIGVRHLLPLLPLCLLAIPQAFYSLRRTSYRVATTMLAISIVWLAVVSLWIQPHYLSYFNELAGGPSRGWRYLSDSNADWGQASRLWADYSRRHPGTTFKTALHPADPPSQYGARDEDVLPVFFKSLHPGVEPQLTEGTYAVSTAFLVSRRIGQLAFLRDLAPVDHVGYVIRVYAIGPVELARYRDWLRSWTPDPAARF
ncbi:MAG: ArnT family glycosyltransferase [Acidobacteriota bacterium]